MSVPLFTGPAEVPAHPTHALILLHGFGDEGASWLYLAQMLKTTLPQRLQQGLALFAPNGPAPTPAGQGRQWFKDNGWTFRDPDGLDAAANGLETYLTHLTATYGVTRENMAVLGFSQGGMVSLHGVPRLSQPVAAHMAVATQLMDPLPDPIALVPTLVLHGQDDDVLLADHAVKTAHALEAAGVPTRLEIIPGMGHEVTPPGLAHLSVFLAAHLA